MNETETMGRTFNNQEEQLEAFSQSIKKWGVRIGTIATAIEEMQGQKKRFAYLLTATRPYTEALVITERDNLTHSRVELQNAIDATQFEQDGRLKKQLNALQREHKAVVRQLEAKTIQQVWERAGFDETHRALLNFLVANELSSLDASEAIDSETAFVGASARVVEDLDDQDNYRGFGLDIPRSVWFVSDTDKEPLDARKLRLEQEMANIREALDVADNTEKKKQELVALTNSIQAKTDILNQFNELHQLIGQWPHLNALEAELGKRNGERHRLERAISKKEDEMRSLRKAQHRTHTALQTASNQLQQVSRVHDRLQTFDGDAPALLGGMPLDALRDEYDQVRIGLDEIVSALQRLTMELSEPKADLEERYERSATDIPFDRWLEQKLDLAEEISGLEAQLQREYDGIFTVVRAKLSKITQAYENVQALVAALNKAIHNVRISNIEQIGIAIEQTALLDAIDQSMPGQMDLFAAREKTVSLDQAHALVESYFNQIKNYGNEINLMDMFRLKFSVKFNYQDKSVERYEIHRFESNGTETGVKIVIYLGLIGLLQERKNTVRSRIPFFLDEVGSIDSENLNQLIAYCTRNNFLPIFASPEIRKDISHNYLFRRSGSRSYLSSVVKISRRKTNPTPYGNPNDESSGLVERAF